MQQILNISQHEYVLAFFGVILWQLEQLYVKPKNRNFKTFKRNTIRSMIWIGPIIVFDDEILAQYNNFAILDYAIMPPWMYIVLGFSIDIIRTQLPAKFTGEVEAAEDVVIPALKKTE